MLLILVAGLAARVHAQEGTTQNLHPWQDSASGMDHNGAMPHDHKSMSSMEMGAMNAAGMFLMGLSSGTAVNPAAWRMPMLMKDFGSWNTMFMAQAFIDDTQQSGPRGGDKLYSTNWIMVKTEHSAGGNGAVAMQLMLSLEPVTVTRRRYPLLFQTGETAYGKPIVDGQHPHDFIMALGLEYAYALSENTTLELYIAPVGDPALGPVAYPHRASAMELPQATISHHWQDSTHIADDVVTAALSYKKFKFEASGFHGAEPDEFRWDIDSGPIDSWSTRLWFFPTKNWAAQMSVGHLTHPEVTEPGNQTRVTGSIEYSKPLASGSSWSTSLIWGRDHSSYTKRNLNSYTLESLVPVHAKNFVSARAELVDKDELFAAQPGVEEFLNTRYGTSFRVGAFTMGYTRDFDVVRKIETGLGFNITGYSLPPAIKRYYGNHPVGANVFLRLRLNSRD
ncbi:MAG: hypothetical protein JOZ62_07965 [Acidobacteriaceae bacterium]|nr:hypothetical protein [Acidobacteriaceae bacterium]